MHHFGQDPGFDDNIRSAPPACGVRAAFEPRPQQGRLRLNPIEANTYRRDLAGRVQLAARRLRPGSRETPWKLDKYRRGPLVTTDAAPFLAPVRA